MRHPPAAGAGGAAGWPAARSGRFHARVHPRLLAEFKPRTPQTFIASFYDEDATQANLLKIIENLTDGVSELMSHPGYADADLLDVQSGSIYARQRESELTILTAPEVRDAIQRRCIELITFRDL